MNGSTVTRNTLSDRFRISVLLVSALLLAGNAAALTWSNPSSDNQNFDEDITLKVNNGSSGSGEVTFQYKGPDSSEFEIHDTVTLDSDHNASTSFDVGNLNSNFGEYEFRANYSGTTEDITGITLDGEKPDVSSLTPSDDGYTNEGDDLDVSFSSSDSHTSVAHENITIFSQDESDTDNDLTGLSLSDDSYDVNYYVRDDVGNWNNGSWSFTVDTSYDGDSSPSFPQDNIQELGSDEQLDLEVELDEEDEGTDITVTCYDSEDDEIDSVTKAVDSDNTVFNCEVDGDDYSDTSQNVWVEMCDEAGNCVDTEGEEENFIFDGSGPMLSDPGIPGNVVNSDFDVEFSAYDISGIQSLEYFYDDSSVLEGEGNSIDISNDTGEFEASVSNLNSGPHTVYFRVQDSVGKWSGTKSLGFDYRPNAEPEVGFDFPDVNVTAGDSKSFDVDVENTGNIFIEQLNVTASAGDFYSQTTAVEELAPNESRTVAFTVKPQEENIGAYDLKVSTSTPETSASSRLRVKTTEEQRGELDQKFEKFSQRLEALEANISQLESSGLSEDRKQRLESNISEFRERVENAEDAVNTGDYFKAASELEDIKEEYSQASDALEDIRQEHRDAKRSFYLKIGAGILVLLLLLGAGVGVFVYRSEDHQIPLELDGFRDKLESIRSSEEDGDDEFEWDGFED